MHPDLEFFLEEAFKPVEQTSPEIGRVVVEPDYNADPDPKDAGHLVSELAQCLREEALADKVKSSGPSGCELEIPGAYRLLRKYVRSITLHGDKVEGDWIEVAPPGNWI